uniref:Uncharacterized protein n=1 Tax=viral metagenome TaxID=1070528 RepID=A0A6H1ZDR4_9ZZZZ
MEDVSKSVAMSSLVIRGLSLEIRPAGESFECECCGNETLSKERFHFEAHAGEAHVCSSVLCGGCAEHALESMQRSGFARSASLPRDRRVSHE